MFFCLLLFAKIHGQFPCPQEVNVPSIIPNPSFEQQSCCPNTYSQLSCAGSWIQASAATADYMSTCGFMFGAATDIGLVPADGNSMAGFIVSESYREYVGSCLMSTMLPGVTYQLRISIASTPIDASGFSCNNGGPFSPIPITLFGSGSCSDLPFSGTDCPMTSGGGWQVLGTSVYTPSSTWGVMTLNFTPSVPINAICIGSPCGPLAPDYNSGYCYAYFYIDNMILNQLSLMQTHLTQTGAWCSNNLQLSGTVKPGATYQWYLNGNPIAGAVNPFLNVSANNLPPGYYTLQTYLGLSCSSVSDSVLMPPPIQPSITSGGPFCITSAAVTLSASATGGTWSGAGITNSITGIFDPSVAGAGNSIITYSIASSCYVTSTTSIHVGNLPTTAMTQTNVLCHGGSTGIASASATGGSGTYTYSWSPSGGSGASATGLSIGIYSCTIVDGNSCSRTQTVMITEPPALQATTSQTNVACYGGLTGAASVSATGGTGIYGYSWTPTGVAGSISSGIGVGAYTCTIVDGNLCSNTQTVTINGPTALSLSVAGIDATCHSLCNGQTIVIPTGGTAPYQYAWSSGCSSASCSNLCTGNYTVVVTDSHSCTATATTTVNQPTALTMSTAMSSSHCGQADGTATLTATGGTGAYTQTWTPAGGTGATAGNLLPGTYTVTMKDGNNCVASTSVTVTDLAGVAASVASATNVSCYQGNDGSLVSLGTGGFPPYNYSWSPIGGTGVQALNLTQGIYTVTITDSKNCVSTATAAITEPGLLTVNASTVSTLCIGQTAVLTATANGGTPAYTYTWYDVAGNVIAPSVTPGATGIYSVVATDAHQCVTAAHTVTVPVYPPLSLTVSGATSICVNTTARISAAAAGGNGNYVYTWTPNTVSPVNTATTVASPGSITTVYTVTVHDGCTTPQATNTVQIVVYKEPVVSFSATTVSGCEALCVEFTGSSSPASINCSWVFGDGQTGNAACSHVNHCYKNDGVYSVTLNVTDANNCPGTGTRSHYITVYPLPETDYTYNPVTADLLEPYVYFTNTSSGAINYSWLFGDDRESTSLLKDPVFVYPDSGCYHTRLIAISEHGCLDTITKPICIKGAFALYVPNAFTPNGDHVNDLFMPKGTGVSEQQYEFSVYDRWGEQVFRTTTWGEGWNGTAKGAGTDAKMDVYVWKVSCKDLYQKEHRLIGHVTLIK